MAEVTTGEILDRARQVGILTMEHFNECWEELGTRNVSNEELIRALQRKGFLTPLQLDKLKRGDTEGYFYGAYKVLYKVASGGFARVYRGVNTQTGEPAAIKVLRKRWTRDPAFVEAFRREGRIGQLLRHPNIVRIDEVGGHGETHYIAMEFVEGGNLRDFLKIRGGKVEGQEAIRLMLDCLYGLAYAFDQGVTHRDIKLTNVLASTEGKLKLVDFGLATVHKNEQLAEEAHGQRTIEYAALEKLTGVEKGDPRSDIFFLGAVFYQMVSGHPPFAERRDRVSRLLRTRVDTFRPLSEAFREVDPRIAAIVDRMMAIDVHERYQTPHDVIQDLERLRGKSLKPATEQPAEQQGERAERDQPIVLFLETDSKMQDAVRAGLHKIGYRVLITATAERAVDRFRDTQPDCVVVDAQTVKEAGLAALEQMHEHAQKQKWPWAAVALMPSNHDAWIKKATNLGAKVLVKPVTFGQLRDAVKSLVPIGS